MRPAIRRGSCLLGTCSLLVLSLPFTGIAQAEQNIARIPQCVAMARTAADIPGPKPVPAQVHHDARANATFFFSVASDGGVRMTVKAGELEVEKVVYRDGRSRIMLKAGDDVVSASVDVGVLDLRRSGSQGLRLDSFRATDDEWLQVKVLLAGSKALRGFRILAASLDPRTLKTPAGAAVILSDALLGYLDGDVAAISRFLEQMRAARQARIRLVRLAEDDGMNPCWDNYQKDTLQAADDYDGCRKMFYWYDPRQAACAFVWTVQVESAWAVFLSCSSISIPKIE